MSELRIKVNSTSKELEIEGDKTTVLETFEKLKQYLIISKNENIGLNPIISDQSNPNTPVNPLANTLPSLKSIVLKNPKISESEWVLVYCYIASLGGTKEFTRQDILNKYDESKRKTVNRLKNLTASIKVLVNANSIDFINDNDILMTQTGIEKAMSIFNK